jgi:hypothetical protein
MITVNSRLLDKDGVAIDESNPIDTVNPNNDNVLYRSDLAGSPDCIVAYTGSSLTLTDVATGGSLLAATLYYACIHIENDYGVSPTTGTFQSITTAAGGNTHILQLTVPQKTGATGYHVYTSTDSSPKWVGYITEAQRAAGCSITAVGTVGAGTAAGKVDVQVVGTGSLANTITTNSAFIFTNVTMLSSNATYAQLSIIGTKSSSNFTSARYGRIFAVYYNDIASKYSIGTFYNYQVTQTSPGQSFMQTFAPIQINGCKIGFACEYAQSCTLNLYVRFF